MALMLENMGLDSFLENEETMKGLIAYCVDQGRPLLGYSGGIYYMHHFRDAQICVRVTVDDENKTLQYTGIDSHEDSWTNWYLRVVDDITPSESDILFRRILFRNDANGEGILPIDLVNADVIESFLPDDLIKLQMIGFPVQINYFATEDDYTETCEEWNGKKLGLDDGTVVPTGFLKNNNPENEEHDDNLDSYVALRGTVKQLFFAYLEEDTEEQKAKPAFIRCIIGTKYGDLELCHTYFQVDEEQRDNIEVGAIVSGVFVLSGDVALDDRSPNGAIFNEESDLRVFRQAIEKGDIIRLKTILAENAVFVSDTHEETYVGSKEIIERFKYIQDNQKNEEVEARTFMATLTNENGDNELDYQTGKRCVIISYDDGETYTQVLFLDVNEKGKVERLAFSKESRYTFKIDEVPDYSDDEDDEDKQILTELLQELSTEEGREHIQNRMLLNHLETLCECYSTGDFEPLFFMLADNVVFESQWVLTPLEGRKAVEEYLIGKGETLKKCNAFPECQIVRLIGNVNPTEAEVSINGDDSKPANIGLLYSDGKLCMLMTQKKEDKTNSVLVDITMDERNLISRIDLCMPELFNFETFIESQNV